MKYIICLKYCPAARNNDKLLQVLVLKRFYGVHSIDDILRPNVPSLESIRRCRQKLQSEGYYKAAEIVQKKRVELESVYKEFAHAKE